MVYETKQNIKNLGHKDTQYSESNPRNYTHTGYERREWNEREDRNDNRRPHDIVYEEKYEDRSKRYGKDRKYYSNYPYDQTKATQRHYRDWEDDDHDYQSQIITITNDRTAGAGRTMIAITIDNQIISSPEPKAHEVIYRIGLEPASVCACVR